MFNAVLSDDGAHVLMFHDGMEIPEEMGTYEFTAIYGTEILRAADKLDPSEITPESHTKDIENYWKAFRQLVKNCGDYAHKLGLQRNAADGVLEVQIIIYRCFRGSDARPDLESDPYKNLVRKIDVLNRLRMVAVDNLDYWSHKRLGLKRFSMPSDVEKYNLRKSDAEILLNHLANPDFRKRMYYRIDKYAKKGQLVAPDELVLEVLKSFKKKPRQPS